MKPDLIGERRLGGGEAKLTPASVSRPAEARSLFTTAYKGTAAPTAEPCSAMATPSCLTAPTTTAQAIPAYGKPATADRIFATTATAKKGNGRVETAPPTGCNAATRTEKALAGKEGVAAARIWCATRATSVGLVCYAIAAAEGRVFRAKRRKPTKPFLERGARTEAAKTGRRAPLSEATTRATADAATTVSSFGKTKPAPTCATPTASKPTKRTAKRRSEARSRRTLVATRRRARLTRSEPIIGVPSSDFCSFAFYLGRTEKNRSTTHWKICVSLS